MDPLRVSAATGASRWLRRTTQGLAVACILSLASLVPGGAAGAVPGAREALTNGDCDAAGKAINDGLTRDDAEAYFLAGVLYEQSPCVVLDAVRAARLYRRAIALGDEDAPVSLGLLLALGRGIPQDAAMAHRAFNGDKPVAGDATATASELAAMGYVEAVARLAVPQVAYPMTANRNGIEGTIDVVFTPASGRIDFEQVRIGTEIGSTIPRNHDFIGPIEAAYGSAMARVPRPDIAFDPALRIVTPWRFAMRRLNGTKVRSEGRVTLGETRSVR